MSEYQFKVGDRVRIWDKHEEDRNVPCGYVGKMLDCAGMEATITEDRWGDGTVFLLDVGRYNTDGRPYRWSAPMLSLVSSETDDQPDHDFVEICLADLEAILGGVKD